MSYWHLGPMPGGRELQGIDYHVSRYLEDAMPEHILSDLQLAIRRDSVTDDLVFVTCAYREEVCRITGCELLDMTRFASLDGALRAIRKRLETDIESYYEPILIMRRAQVGG